MAQNHEQINVMLFLGAGASHFAGYQTFATFPQLLLNPKMRDEEDMPSLSLSSERILKDIETMLVRRNLATTHDNFLWRLDGYIQFLRLSERDEVLQQYVKDSGRLFDLTQRTNQAIEEISATTIKHYSVNMIHKAQGPSSQRYIQMKRVFDIYCELALLNGGEPFLPIFTTNYDMLIEDLVCEFGSQASVKFNLVNGIPNMIQEQALWNSNEYYKRGITRQGIHLYRLHGCACWFGDGNSKILFHRRDASQQGTTSLCAMYPGRQTERGTDPHGFAFRAMYRHLQICKVVAFIGFSFRDDDVMHVLLKALSERRVKPKILVVDPLNTIRDVRDKLEDAAKRTTFPHRIPRDTEMVALKIPFGEEEHSDRKIIEICRNLINQ